MQRGETTKAGHLIRQARTPKHCQYWHGKAHGFCGAPIAKGDLYAQGEINPDDAGGYGHWAYCAACSQAWNESITA